MALENSAVLRKHHPNKDELILSATGEKLSERASTFCLMLACCECNRVPAFLFSRPYFSQRRWTAFGEVYVSQPQPQAAPQWSSGLFERVGDIPDSKSVFHATSLGLCENLCRSIVPWPPFESQPTFSQTPYQWSEFPQELKFSSSVALDLVSVQAKEKTKQDKSTEEARPIMEEASNEDIQTLMGLNIIHPRLDEDWLYFELSGSWIDSIRRECSTEDRVRLLYDLARLVASAYPDPYAESLWQIIRVRSKDIIDSTVLPFLSVLCPQDVDYREGTYKQERLFNDNEIHTHHVFEFLTRYSISEGFSANPAVTFGLNALVRPLGVGLSMAFKDQICQYLASPNLSVEHLDALTANMSLEHGSPHTSALVGLFIDSLLRSITATSFEAKLTALVGWWKAKRCRPRSTMDSIAECLVSVNMSEGEVSAPACPNRGDIQIRIALGFTMAERHRFAFAKTLFEECMDGQYSSHEPFVYNLVAAEFVKCCNSLKQYSEGEEWARRCLSSERTSHLVSRTYLKIALADSLIGQGKYVQAEPLLNDISNKTNLSDYLVTVTAIRLNRVKRRLGDKQKLRLDEGSALLKALDSLDGADQALRLEYAEEVISTISLLNQGGLTDIAEARTVIAAARGNLVNDPTLKTNWRLAVLERLDEVMSFDQKTMTGPANKGHIPYSTLEAVIQSDEEEETSDEDPYMVVDVMVEIDDNITFPPEQSITILQGEMPRRNYPTTQQRQMPRRSPISLPEQAAFPFPSTAVKIGLLTADINSTETDCMDLNDLRDTAVVQTITTTNKPLSFFSENKDSITRLEASAIKYYRSPASRSFWEERISREEWSDELYQLIRQGKPLYLIRGYLTYLGAEILERPKRGTFTSAATHTGQPTDILLGSTLDSTEEGERVIRLKGEYIAAMYVSRVMAERPPKRRAWFGSKFALDDPKLALGDSEWVTYWGIPGDELERFFPEY